MSDRQNDEVDTQGTVTTGVEVDANAGVTGTADASATTPAPVQTKPDGWALCQDLMTAGTVVQAQLFCRAHKGAKDGPVVGVRAKLHGLVGFVPQGSLPRGVQAKTMDLRGTIDVVVVKCDKGTKDLVFNALVAQEKKVAALIGQLAVGQDVTGVVGALLPKSALVHLDAPYAGVTGSVPAGEIAGDRNANPADLLKKGDKVLVRVLRPKPEEGKVMLSIRGPKVDDALRALVEQQEVTGHIMSVADYGYFVKVGLISGLLPLTQMPEGENGREVYVEGQEIKARILDVNLDKREFCLTQLEPRAEGDRPRQRGQRGSDSNRGGDRSRRQDRQVTVVPDVHAPGFCGTTVPVTEPVASEDLVTTEPVVEQKPVRKECKVRKVPDNARPITRKGETKSFGSFAELAAAYSAGSDESTEAVTPEPTSAEVTPPVSDGNTTPAAE